MEIRKEIMEFCKQMELVMATHDAAKGDTWKTMPLDKLDAIFQGMKEDAYLSPNDYVDLANLCMMLRARKWILKQEVKQ